MRSNSMQEQIIELMSERIAKLCGKVEWLTRERDEARSEVARLNKDLATQQGCCDGAAAQDAHIRREREEHRAEVEKLRSEIERLKQEPELLRAELISLANAARNALADAYDRAREGKP